MTYFLDFDRTIFDTNSFKNEFGSFMSLERPLFFRFKALDLQRYLYPEVSDFLKANAENCTIVTYGVRMFFIAKVTNALADFPTLPIVYTTRRKGRTIRRLSKEKQAPFTFVDDMHFQLASVSARCPDVTVVEMRRDGGKGDGRWPVIHSLTELPLPPKP